MSRQLVPLALVVAAALSEAFGSPVVAFYLLLVAIPVIGAVALASYGDVVAAEGEGSAGRTALWTVALVVVLGAVALPSLGNAALIACLVVVGLQGVASLSAELRRASSG